jgi:hypothetical protein
MHTELCAGGSSAGAGGVPQSTQFLRPGSVLGSAASSVVIGVLVALSRYLGLMLWRRARVPSALSRRVRRRSYLNTVLAESTFPEVIRLDVYAPRLQPARDNGHIAIIQAEWEKINDRGRVRVLIISNDEGLQAGAELLDRGMEVRVLPDERGLGSDGLTFHLFETSVPDEAIAIINHYHQSADRPGHFKGVALTEVFRSRFDAEWEKASPLESVIARRVLPCTTDGQGPGSVRRCIEQAEATGLYFGVDCAAKILPHLAFRDSCAVVFILGLPGSGKSYIRSRLALQLGSERFEVESLSDYPYAYQNFVRNVLKLDSQNGNAFRACEGGAFTVQNEKTLAPALHALHGAVLESMRKGEVALVEFARADLATALQVFDDIRPRSRVIYVRAAEDLRQRRLAARAVPPEVRIDGHTLTLKLSDDHLLPESAQRALYTADGLDCIKKASAHWRDRIFEIDNESDGSAHVDAKLGEFIDAIIRPYQPASVNARGHGPLVLAHV